jgi:Putative Flp pilus-assembly TadE/G-like
MKAIQNRKRGERGFVLYITLFSWLVLFSMAGLAIDAGYFEWTKRRAQNAADSAVMAAMLDLKAGNSLTQAQVSGQNVAAMNGFTVGGTNSIAVAINNPPVYATAYAGNSNYVEARVTTIPPTIFMQVLGTNSIKVNALAVAAISSTGSATTSGCVYALDPTASRALQVAGSGNLINTYCGWIDESNNSNDAYEMEGNFTVGLYNGSKVSVLGHSQINNQNYLLNEPVATQATPAALSTSPGDPLSSLVAPTSTGMTMIKNNGNSDYDMNAKPAANTLHPGIYCGGLTVGQTNGATFTMAAGTYVMAGGGFNLQSQAIVDATAGVTIYNTNSTGWGCANTYNYSPVVISGQVTFTQKAPTTGSLAGIAMFGDRSLGSSGTQDQINGGSTTVIDGALYFKNDTLLFSGTGTNSGYLILVADKVIFNGNSAVTINANYSSLPNGSPIAGSTASGSAGLVQ